MGERIFRRSYNMEDNLGFREAVNKYLNEQKKNFQKKRGMEHYHRIRIIHFKKENTLQQKPFRKTILVQEWDGKGEKEDGASSQSDFFTFVPWSCLFHSCSNCETVFLKSWDTHLQTLGFTQEVFGQKRLPSIPSGRAQTLSDWSKMLRPCVLEFCNICFFLYFWPSQTTIMPFYFSPIILFLP